MRGIGLADCLPNNQGFIKAFLARQIVRPAAQLVKAGVHDCFSSGVQTLLYLFITWFQQMVFIQCGNFLLPAPGSLGPVGAHQNGRELRLALILLNCCQPLLDAFVPRIDFFCLIQYGQG